jgi:hypothetical protein
MAVRHTTGFLPPVVKVPMDASIGPQVGRVIDGIQRKYGLRTTVLRQIARFGDYQCIELELHGQGSPGMQAVWVGLQDYARMRETTNGVYDPLADWLREKERGIVPSQRPPWERRGWFKGAVQWINHQLDRLNIQATGSVSQQQALSHAGTILRVPTAFGRLYFKAGYEKAPKEAPLIRFLAEKWPGQVTALLAQDDARNWMLMPDLASDNRYSGSPGDLEKAAAAMARIQVESVEQMAPLKDLGCPELGMEQLGDFLANPALAHEFPALDKIGLTDDERVELANLSPRLAVLCEELARLGLPETLVHPDFRASNFFLGPDSVRFIDWQNSCLAQPFFCVMKLLRDNHPSAFGSLAQDPVVQAYLQPFRAFGSDQQLLRAMDLTAQLQHAWRLLRWSREFPWFEPGGVSMVLAQRVVTKLARQLLEAHRPSPA